MSLAARRSRSAAAPAPRLLSSSSVREVKDDGYIKIPWGFFKIAAKHLTHSQLLILGRVLEETTFKPRRKGSPAPEEWNTQETALARELGVTERTVRDVLEDLGDDGGDGPGVIQYRRCGRGISVRVTLDRDRLARLRCRDPRKLTRAAKVEPDEPGEETAAAADETKVAKPVPARLECPVGLECPVTALCKIEGAWTNAPPGVESPAGDSKRNSGSAFEGAAGVRNRNSGSALDGVNGHRNRNSGSAFEGVNGSSNRNSGSAFEQLQNWSNSYAISKFGRILDVALCTKIITELGPAPVLSFTSLVESRAARGGAIGFGLLALLAHDARVTWEAGRALREQQLRAESSSSDAVIEDWRRKLRRPGLDAVELELIREACPELAEDVDGYRFRPVRA